LSQILTRDTPAAAITTEAVIIGAGPCGLFQVFELGLLGISAHVVDRCGTRRTMRRAVPRQADLRHSGAARVQRPGTGRPAHATDQAFKPQLHLGHEVVEFARRETGRFHLRTAGGVSFEAGTVVIAAGVGSFQARRIGLEGADAFEAARSSTA